MKRTSLIIFMLVFAAVRLTAQDFKFWMSNPTLTADGQTVTYLHIYQTDDNNGIPQYEVGVSGHARADGGVASIPTIVGERGAEMVIPFDYARRGRANNLVQTFNQTFNLAQNQTTASSLAATMRTNGRWGR